eukprot:CAMPEP_0175052648 /NCGR_PEP_ID=MMETSP0052_2-20121109/8477_1 /TAXON_ID=51329 ORGANISM="Polytomella parva, Strain SAG 63-3" /NCGR_SAMPLE_ID=MMETSP0052_2 /ASSEMBLY_ACC=CAM_ASM_000194 /LENGTH=87 /DNA_ID=CAMNT_0016317077 /DNA_START=626 /DNA_END=889 /DNA_ORIENTATION=-
MAAKKKEINQVEEAAKRARSKAKQAAKQARDTAQCAKQSRAAVKKAREDAIRNVPGKIGMLQWPKAFRGASSISKVVKYSIQASKVT